MQFSPDRCPKCGEPPREFTVTTRIHVGLTPEAKGHESTPDPHRVRLPRGMKGEVELLCGGGHTWKATIKVGED